MKKRLAIVCTHPIQYYAPVFRLIGESPIIDLKVFYTLGEQAIRNNFDPGFGKVVSWDIPLLDGYNYELLENSASNPTTSVFSGIKNPNAVERIAAFAPDAILVYGWLNTSHLKILRKFKGKVPVWFRGDSHLLDAQGPLKKSVRKLLLTWIYGHVDKAFYVGSANRAYYLNYGLKAHQLTFSPHAIDNERFGQNRSTEAVALRTELGASPSDIIIMFAGKLETKKNPAILLNSFEQIYKPGMILLFVGNGDLEQSLKEKARASKVSSLIQFRDFQNQQIMPVFYQACDIFCLPSNGPGETWGLSVNEAMAAKKAVIVSNKVGCAFDLISESNGCIFKANDQHDLINKLLSLINNRSELPFKGKCSSDIIKDWTFRAQVKIIEKAFDF